MKQYIQSTVEVLNGTILPTRGTPSISKFGIMSVYDCSVNHPIVTVKKQGIKNMTTELVWNCKGLSNNKWLKENGCHIWDEFDVVKVDYIDALEYLEERGVSVDSSVLHEDDVLKIAVSLGMDETTGDLGPVYGDMLANWPTTKGESINQLRELIDNIRNNPFSRRHIVSMWNPEFLPNEKESHETNIKNGKQVLPPCHILFQVQVVSKPLFKSLFVTDHITDLKAASLIYDTLQPELTFSKWVTSVIKDEASYVEFVSEVLNSDDIKKAALSIAYNDNAAINTFKEIYNHRSIDLLFFMRSNDKPLGEPYNVSNYAELLASIAHCVDMKRGRLIHMTGNSHVYLDQLEGVSEMLKREPKESTAVLTIKDRGQRYLDEFEIDDFDLENYESYPKIEFPMNV